MLLADAMDIALYRDRAGTAPKAADWVEEFRKRRQAAGIRGLT